MKRSIVVLLLCLASVAFSQEAGEERIVVIPVAKPEKPVPLFFSAKAVVEAAVALDGVTTRQSLDFTLHQGRAEVLTLGLSGNGDVVSVEGDGLRDWSVRTAGDGARFLDLRPVFPEDGLSVVVNTRSGNGGSVLLPGQGGATGFSLELKVEKAAGVDFHVREAEGLAPVEGSKGSGFVGSGSPRLDLEVHATGTGTRGLRMTEAKLEGRLAENGGSMSFRLEGMLQSTAEGGALDLLGGGAALSGGASGDAWHVVLREGRYELVSDAVGEFPVAIDFTVPVRRSGDWREAGFSLPAGVVVPVVLTGLGEDLEFSPERVVVPRREGDAWKGYLPAGGEAGFAWRSVDEIRDGALFFSSDETTEVRVGSGLLRQSSVLDLRVMQGRLPGVVIGLEGQGEVLAVEGEAVLGWEVREGEDGWVLEVRFSRPVESAVKLEIETQTAMGGLPAAGEALRLNPQGALRHGGWLRVTNDGAVRLSVTQVEGLIQTSPEQFPGEAGEGVRQVFVYRIPAAGYGYGIQADQIMPEVGVGEVSVYEFSESDRRISSDLELDVREAALSEWEVEIPADHAVLAVTGAMVADHSVQEEVREGRRVLKVIFREEVMGRQLVGLRLEKNEAAGPGIWEPGRLGFPGAKSHRGYVGVVAAAGYRLAVGGMDGLAEVPVGFFPKRVTGMQHGFRIREADWKVELAVEALGRSVQADVFHLYSIKEGAASASVLINYFVVGAPASEWRIEIPGEAGNVEVTGQNVGRDWRREGETLVIPLSRPMLGAGTVLVTFEQPMQAGGGVLAPGAVRPLGVQDERGYVQVVSPLQVNYEVSSSEGPLMEIDASELPAEFRLLSNAPTLGAWQYTGRDFGIGLKLDWFARGETVEQVVDFMKLSTRVSRDGQWVTDVRFFLKSRGAGALRMVLPEGASLWDARAGERTLNVRADGPEILLPLPEGANPNEAVEMVLRYGGKSKRAGKLNLAAPRMNAPVVIGEWEVTGDENRILVPEGGTAEPVGRVLAETGWSWLSGRMKGGAALLAALAGMVAIRGWRGASRTKAALGLGLGVMVMVLSAWLGWQALAEAEPAGVSVEYTSPVVDAGEAMTIELANVAPWRAAVGWKAVVLGVLAAVVWWLSIKSPAWRGWAMGLTAGALLSVHGGGWMFFAVLFLGVAVVWIPAGIAGIRRAGRLVATTACVLLVIGGSHVEGAALQPAESAVHEWKVSEGRLNGSFEIKVRAEAGDRFLLLAEPAVLSGFSGGNLKVVKADVGGVNRYVLVAEIAGVWSGSGTFQMPLANPADGWEWPGGAAAVRRATVTWDEAGWEFVSDAAARVAVFSNREGDGSGAEMVFTPASPVRIAARPMQRDAAAEETRFFSEVWNGFVPGPGGVTGRHKVSVRLAQGRVGSLVLQVPAGFTVSEVKDGPLGVWRFDPESGELRIAVEPAQESAFSFTVETQRGTGALPAGLELEPLRVNGSAGDVGMLALAFGEEAQAEGLAPEGLSRVNAGDVGPELFEGTGSATTRHAFRYGEGNAKLGVTVAAVTPDVRAEAWQWISLGEDRLVVALDLAVTIARAGVFRLELDVPEGLEVESATGAALAHWSEDRTGETRRVVLDLTGQTLGKHDFHLTLAGSAPGADASWQVPRVQVVGASRQTGIVAVVPERGLQVRAVERNHVSQMDPRELEDSSAPKMAGSPGALVYRVLQADWLLALAVEKLEPWVTAQVLHEETLREGQALSRVGISYRIENAALKALRLRIPGLDEAAAATLRATGPAVADLVSVGDGVWELRFQRGMTGDARVDLEYQRAVADGVDVMVTPVEPEGVRQLSYFVAVRAGGRMEVETGPVPAGWHKVDWAELGGIAARTSGEGSARMAFRVAEAESPLPLVLKRHELAGLRKLRVESGTLTSLLSPDGGALTAVDLKMETEGKSDFRVRLPAGSELYHVSVNDEGVSLVREGEEWLFHVFPSPGTDRLATVRFAYSGGDGRAGRLQGPLLNVPLENLTWRILVPEGWKISEKGGDFDLTGISPVGAYRIEDYESFAKSRRSDGFQEAASLLDQANSWLRRGDQARAGEALGNALRSNMLDEASNEDARVQFRQLRTQQAVLGLSTRRQKVALDRNQDSPHEDQARFEREVLENPLMRGDSNFNPAEFDRFLAGNTAEENAALREIARRIVAQQLAADPVPGTLDVTLPEKGTVATFARSVQVDGGEPMVLHYDLRRAGPGPGWLAAGLCLVLGVAGAKLGRKSGAGK